MDERGRRMAQRSQIDVALGFAARALDLGPAIAAVDGLVDRRGRVERPTIRPQAFVDDSHRSLSAWRIKASPLARASADFAARIVVIARARPSSFCSAFRSPPLSGVGWCFGAIRARSLEQRPAAVFLMPTRPDRARVVQQPLADVLPDRVRTVQPDGVGLLNLDGSAAAPAAHPQ